MADLNADSTSVVRRVNRLAAMDLGPALILAVLALSYFATGNPVRAVGTSAATVLAAGVATAGVQRFATRQRPSLLSLLPIAVSALLARRTEDLIEWSRSIPFLALAIGLAILVSWGFDLGPPVRAVARGLATSLRWAVAVIVGVVLLLPLGVARIWRREDPLGTGAGSQPGSAWHDISRLEAAPDRTFRVERAGRTSPGRVLAAAIPRALGVILMLLVADYAVGTTWSHLTGNGSAPTPPVVADPVGPASTSADLLPDDPREALPAVASDAWISEWFDEFRSAGRDFWPYLLWRNAPFAGEYLNIEGWERASYQPALADPTAAPVVGFFGGSTTYGIAQRDEHTIASEVSRLAEVDGLPIIPRNHGVSGYVNWQEMLQFEQFTASVELRSDIAVFYDGANELQAQMDGIVGVPAHSEVAGVAERLMQSPGAEAPEANPLQETPGDITVQVQDLFHNYQRQSATGQLARWLRATLDPPVGATPIQDRRPTDDEVEASMSVYHRGRDLIIDIGQDRGVATVFFWQPRLIGDAEKQMIKLLDGPTIDLSGSLEGRNDVYIDGTHHNEEGARIVAAAMWEELRPTIEAWYQVGPGG